VKLGGVGDRGWGWVAREWGIGVGRGGGMVLEVERVSKGVRGMEDGGVWEGESVGRGWGGEKEKAGGIRERGC